MVSTEIKFVINFIFALSLLESGREVCLLQFQIDVSQFFENVLHIVQDEVVLVTGVHHSVNKLLHHFDSSSCIA